MEAKRPVPTLDIRAFTGQKTVEECLNPIRLADYERYRITTEKEYPNNEPVITWDGAGVAAPANITAISAAAKAGKTGFTSVLVAGAISQGGQVDGFSSIHVAPNRAGKAVICLDSEQSEFDQQYNVRTTLRRVDLQTTPNYLLAYNIRQLSIDNYKQFTDNVCAAASEEFNGIHSIFIDGGADYIKSVNDEEAATEIVEYFTHLAIRYNCLVIVIVHLNPNSDKERGHFGSQIQRKCYGLIGIKKDGDVSCAEPKIMRKAGVSDLQPVFFKYSKDHGYHVQIDAPNKEKEAGERLYNQMQQTAKDVFSGQVAYTYTVAVEKIMMATKKAERTSKDYIKYMAAFGLIKKHDDGHYRAV